MGVRNVKKEELARLHSKSLDAQFKAIVVEGLGCSPFEAEAVVEAAREVYTPFPDQASPQVPPGKVSLVAVCADEPAGKPVAQCLKRTICLTVHGGPHDDLLLQRKSPRAFRQERIPQLCQEALTASRSSASPSTGRPPLRSARVPARGRCGGKKRDCSIVTELLA